MQQPTPDATAIAGAPSSHDRLPMVATVGFTGHRSFNDPAAARAALTGAVDEIGRAFDLVASSPVADAFDGVARMRLMIGAAPGADRLAAETWREASLGEIHLFYPFRDLASTAAWTDRPEKADPDTRIEPAAEFAPWTGIDSRSFGIEGDFAHAEVARWIVRQSELLLAWWDGLPSRGAGGTADTIEHALARDLPVVWLKPGEHEARLIDPALVHRHGDAAEALTDVAAAARPLTAEALALLLSAALAPPDLDDPGAPEGAARRDYAEVDPLTPRNPALAPVQRFFDRTVWTAFKRFERLAGGVPPRLPARETPQVPAAVAAQPGYVRLRAASAEASARAGHLSAIHRSEQLLLVAIAIVAVAVGASPALSEPGAAHALWHQIAAGCELALGIGALGIAGGAQRAHRHRRWSDARALAERFRGACSTWPLGVDITDAHAGAPQTWTEWRARAVIRAAGPRRGWINRPRFEETVAWASAQLIDGQIAYHARQHHVAENIERNIRRVETGAFGLLMLTLAAYLTATLIAPISGWTLPPWIGGVVTLVSAVSPAVGAGCLALESTNGFGEMALHSARLEAAFEALKHELGQRPVYHHGQTVLRRAAQLLADDADAWRDRLRRRRIVRG